MKTVVGLTALACALLVSLAGCGGGPAYSAPVERPTTGSVAEKARSGGTLSRSGERKVLGNGLSIAISAPKSFVPTASAYPDAPRALGFEITVENDGATAYRPTGLSLAASANGVVAQQVIDSTQGYAGLVGAADVPPGQSVRFSIAFAMPADKATVQISAQPDPAARNLVTVFDGTA
ncbi:hypothetical protein [Actinokineospora sp.]|uniref:hypothetical protein n=1 Tax=Actinokineospora sp. TaxID=1872133 RepID=UPI004037BF66